MINKFMGCCYGLAIGDALGYQVEFMCLAAIHKHFGPAGVKDFHLHRPALFSDDTQMSLALGRGLIKAKSKQLDEIMPAISREFTDWLESPENNRCPGNTCLAGCRNLRDGKHWSASGVVGAKGCGTSMRTAAIGLVYFNNLEKLIAIAGASSKATHNSEVAIAGGIATAYLVAMALQGVPAEEMPARLINTITAVSSDFAAKIKLVHQVLDMAPAEAYRILGEGWLAHEAVACALYAFIKSPKEFEQTMVTAVNCDGDSDSIGCIAGAISGAYNGLAAIPKRWIDVIEKRDYLKQIAKDLYSKAQFI